MSQPGPATDITAARRGEHAPIAVEPVRVLAQEIFSGKWLSWDLPVDDLRITQTLSGPTIITGVFKPWIENLEEIGLDGHACWIHVEDGGQIRASGILQPGERDPDTGQVTLEALGVSSRPKKRTFQGMMRLANTDPARVVQLLWFWFQATGPGWHLGVRVNGASPARIGTERDEDGNTVFYRLAWWDSVNIGAEIDRLCAETPMDYRERSQWNNTKTQVEQHIDLRYPRHGNRRADLRFAPGENLLEVATVVEDPDSYASKVIVLGNGEGRDLIRGEASTQIGDRVGSEIIIEDGSILTKERAAARAREEIARVEAALLHVSEIVVDATHPNAPYGSVELGDDVRIGPLDLPHKKTVTLEHRVVEITYSPGSDSMTLGLVPSTALNYTGRG